MNLLGHIKNIMKADNFNMKEFINDRSELFIKHPISYIKPSIVQTKDYHNVSYDYSWFNEKINNISLGLETISFIKPLYLLFMGYMCLFFDHVPILFDLAIKQIKWIYVPLLCIVATLLVATPVFFEFKYMYCTIICVPLISFGYLYGENHE